MIDLSDPLLRVAAANRRDVTDFDFRVMALVAPNLSALEARSVKLDSLAMPLKVERSSISRAFKRLAHAGFLLRVDRDDTGTWRYRLPLPPDRDVRLARK